MQTRLFQLLRRIFIQVKRRFQGFQKFFSESLFFCVFGFFCGNFFGTVLTSLREIIPWDGLIIAVILLCSEFLSAQSNRRLIFRLLNAWKIGMFLGFFIDAFKVGS